MKRRGSVGAGRTIGFIDWAGPPSISEKPGFIGAGFQKAMADLREWCLTLPERHAACRRDGMPHNITYLKKPAYFLPSLLGPV